VASEGASWEGVPKTARKVGMRVIKARKAGQTADRVIRNSREGGGGVSERFGGVKGEGQGQWPGGETRGKTPMTTVVVGEDLVDEVLVESLNCHDRGRRGMQGGPYKQNTNNRGRSGHSLGGNS